MIIRKNKKNYELWLAGKSNNNDEISVKESVLSKTNNNIIHNTNDLVLLIIGIVVFLCLIGYCVKKFCAMQILCKNNHNVHNGNINDNNSRFPNDEIVDITTKQFCERTPLITKTRNELV